MKIEKGIKTKRDSSVEIKDLGERTVQFIISKEVEDRDGDILRAAGVELENFKKNPVFLLCHDSHDLPVGKVTDVWVEDKTVKATVYFPTLEELSSDPNNASEKARLVDFVYSCYKNGMLNAVSVGFIPLEYEETKNGYDITKWELLEFSAVPVPANQDAIAEAVKSFNLDESVVKEIFTVEKSGRRISAETKATLDKIKGCADEIEKCRGQLKNITKTMNALLAELEDVEEVIEPEEETPEEKPEEEEGKSFDLESVKSADSFELSEI